MTSAIQNQVESIQKSSQIDPRFKHNDDVEITAESVSAVEKIFASMLPHFPAWRQSCPTDEDLGRLKAAWTKAIIRNSRKTGKKPNFKAGIIACEESESDWLPSVGKFIKWCDQDDGLTELAERAYKIFSNPKWQEKQTCNIGQMVVSGYDFELRNMKAAEGKKRFIELYLEFAENNEIKHLDEFALEDMTTVSYEEEKRRRERESRSDEENKALDDAAYAKWQAEFGNIATTEKEQPRKAAKTGITKGKINTGKKTYAQLEKEKERQLKLAKQMMKK